MAHKPTGPNTDKDKGAAKEGLARRAWGKVGDAGRYVIQRSGATNSGMEKRAQVQADAMGPALAQAMRAAQQGGTPAQTPEDSPKTQLTAATQAGNEQARLEDFEKYVSQALKNAQKPVALRLALRTPEVLEAMVTRKRTIIDETGQEHVFPLGSPLELADKTYAVCMEKRALILAQNFQNGIFHDFGGPERADLTPGAHEMIYCLCGEPGAWADWNHDFPNPTEAFFQLLLQAAAEHEDTKGVGPDQKPEAIANYFGSVILELNKRSTINTNEKINEENLKGAHEITNRIMDITLAERFLASGGAYLDAYLDDFEALAREALKNPSDSLTPSGTTGVGKFHQIFVAEVDAVATAIEDSDLKERYRDAMRSSDPLAKADDESRPYVQQTITNTTAGCEAAVRKIVDTLSTSLSEATTRSGFTEALESLEVYESETNALNEKYYEDLKKAIDAKDPIQVTLLLEAAVPGADQELDAAARNVLADCEAGKFDSAKNRLTGIGEAQGPNQEVRSIIEELKLELTRRNELLGSKGRETDDETRKQETNLQRIAQIISELKEFNLDSLNQTLTAVEADCKKPRPYPQLQAVQKLTKYETNNPLQASKLSPEKVQALGKIRSAVDSLVSVAAEISTKKSPIRQIEENEAKMKAAALSMINSLNLENLIPADKVEFLRSSYSEQGKENVVLTFLNAVEKKMQENGRSNADLETLGKLKTGVTRLQSMREEK
jgi:hypothetical protein